MKISDLNLKIFADGADKETIKKLNQDDLISGFTTNPTLMRNSGVEDYEEFASSILKIVNKKPISFEIFADDYENMFRQSKIISSWGNNVNVKIPITNTKGESSVNLIKQLQDQNININVTAVFTMEQIKELGEALDSSSYKIVSIFAGRIADTGIDPMPLMKEAKKILNKENIDVLWASPREILNIFQAEECKVDIITLTSDMLAKFKNIGKPLNEFSKETVNMFYNDAKLSGYNL